MGKFKIVFTLAVFALAVAAGWQIISCELANQALQSDLRDLSAQVGARIGLNAEHSDDDFRTAVMHQASEHDIELKPEQVIVKRIGAGVGTGAEPVLFLAADYNVRVNLLVYSFNLHFTPSSAQ